MFLVDTSIWIDYLCNRENKGVRYFMQVLDDKIPFGITGIIYQEILQGAATLKDYNQLIKYLSTQEFFHPKDNIVAHQAAARIYFNCRKKGFTIRSSIDCFIAQIAIENNLTLLHNDNDFMLIHKANTELKLFQESYIN